MTPISLTLAKFCATSGGVLTLSLPRDETPLPVRVSVKLGKLRPGEASSLPMGEFKPMKLERRLGVWLPWVVVLLLEPTEFRLLLEFARDSRLCSRADMGRTTLDDARLSREKRGVVSYWFVVSQFSEGSRDMARMEGVGGHSMRLDACIEISCVFDDEKNISDLGRRPNEAEAWRDVPEIKEGDLREGNVAGADVGIGGTGGIYSS